MNKGKIYIVGSGAIGKALAVFLKTENKDVTLIRGSIDDRPATEELITVTNQENQKFQQKITITTFSLLDAVNGVVLIAVKSFANTRIAGKLKDKKGDFSIVLLQNGLNIEQPFASFDKVFRCVLFSTSQMAGGNNVTFKTVTASPVGSITGKNGNPDELVTQINTPHFGFKSEPNILKYVWEKVIINCAFNSICPLLETDNGIFHRNTEAGNLANTVIGECVALAGTYGIELKQREIEEKLLLISQRADGQLISTYEDIRNKRRTEIESLNMEIARLAEEAGVQEFVTYTRLLGKMIQIKSNLNLAE
ncbi:ketopantoate reductase family protein [Sunxiuqinia dokdonensis]|uniref:2-dehydropantoate 2-reductase n=1 Tax=Sunxiuqinia dokdonensis TaxID=1409788 RepID=A0A0L8V3J5_9BACT|nr:2-dehydropantoate 2-reductase [Sunxiuqinia dokdonensis]KOH42943.1 2-dehydropantoate 2-reductase [Sunxiuqinia dokdonensis]